MLKGSWHWRRGCHVMKDACMLMRPSETRAALDGDPPPEIEGGILSPISCKIGPVLHHAPAQQQLLLSEVNCRRGRTRAHAQPLHAAAHSWSTSPSQLWPPSGLHVWFPLSAAQDPGPTLALDWISPVSVLLQCAFLPLTWESHLKNCHDFKLTPYVLRIDRKITVGTSGESRGQTRKVHVLTVL